MHNTATNPLLELRNLGVSAWLDDISRTMIEDGSLAKLIHDDGIAGLTSNPAIFANTIMHDPRYAQPIAQLLPTVNSAMALYEELALHDLRDAAALLHPLYDSSGGGDGFVSMEVSPHLAYDSGREFRKRPGACGSVWRCRTRSSRSPEPRRACR